MIMWTSQFHTVQITNRGGIYAAPRLPLDVLRCGANLKGRVSIQRMVYQPMKWRFYGRTYIRENLFYYLFSGAYLVNTSFYNGDTMFV